MAANSAFTRMLSLRTFRDTAAMRSARARLDLAVHPFDGAADVLGARDAQRARIGRCS